MTYFLGLLTWNWPSTKEFNFFGVFTELVPRPNQSKRCYIRLCVCVWVLFAPPSHHSERELKGDFWSKRVLLKLLFQETLQFLEVQGTFFWVLIFQFSFYGISGILTLCVPSTVLLVGLGSDDDADLSCPSWIADTLYTTGHFAHCKLVTGWFHVKTRRKKVNIKKYFFVGRNMKEYRVIIWFLPFLALKLSFGPLWEFF